MIGRPLSPAEARGFRMACQAMELWGHRVAAQGISLGGPAEPMIPRSRLMAHVGQQAAALARTLELTLAR